MPPEKENLTAVMQTILDQLIDLKGQYIHLETSLRDIGKKVDSIQQTMDGGADTSKGIIVRLDRLEQSEGRRGWLVKSAVGLGLTAVGSVIAAFVRNKF